jgi:hypothetical protein
LPFAKQVYRHYRGGSAVGDTIVRASEPPPDGTSLLQLRMRSGERIQPPESLATIRERREREVATLPAPLRALRTAPEAYPVHIAPSLTAATTPSTPRPERPRDEFGRPLPWGSESKLALLDYDNFSIEKNHDLALDYFNEQQFFSAHEAWEGAWRKAIGTSEEEFFNGLAKLGAGLTHIQRGNSRGARTLIEKAIERIEPAGPIHRGCEVARLCADLRAALSRLPNTGSAPEFAFPSIHRSP